MNTSKILNTMKTKKPEQTPLEKIIKEEQIGRAKQVSEKIEEYEKLIAALPDLLLGYGIQVKELCSSVGMARGTFYNRVKRLDFSPGDLRKVYKHIEEHPRTHKNAPETNEVPQNNEPLIPNLENGTDELELLIGNLTGGEAAEPKRRPVLLKPIDWSSKGSKKS
jgi:hypothetical protein